VQGSLKGRRKKAAPMAWAEFDIEHSNQAGAHHGQADQVGEFQEGVDHGGGVTDGGADPLFLPAV